MKNLGLKIHRSGMAVAMIVVAALYLALTAGIDDGLPAQGEQGLCLPPPALWPISRAVDITAGIAANIAVILLMALINKDFNVLRSNTRLHLGLFALMAAGVPSLVLNINSGIMLALGVNLALFLLFGCYENPSDVRKVFLAFLLLSLGAAMQYCFVVFIPVMWIVVAQMKIFSLRSVLASLFGIVTPWVILLGFGIVGFDDFHLPQVRGLFGVIEEDSALYLLAITGVTSFLLFVAIVLNISRTIAYNARARAFNGALTVVAIVSMLAIIINYNNLLAYLPLLMVCAAYQITHWIVNHPFERQYFVVIAISLLYIAFYLCRIFL